MRMKWYDIAAMLLLLFNGSSIELSPDWLKTTPFKSYLVPGIVLFVCNGLFSLFVIFSILFRARNYPLLINAQGIILCGWLVIQIFLIRTVYYLHGVMGFTGLALIYLGWRSLIHSKK